MTSCVGVSIFFAKMLDPIQQRILGVLIEKEATVPDSYPLTLSSLQSGCNQKNNRDPEMSLESDALKVALQELLEAGWVTRLETYGGRQTVRWRHQFESQLGLDLEQTAILTELLLRGPQAPGALKARVTRLGMNATPERILAVLQELSQRSPPLVARYEKRPRERDYRWGHQLGPEPEREHDDVVATGGGGDVAVASSPAPAAALGPSLAQRVESLESQVAELRRQLEELRARC